MGKKLDKAASIVTKMVGGGALADYAGAKIAKSRLKGTPAAQHVTDTTSKTRAALSAVSVLASMGGVAGMGRNIARGAVKKGASSFKIPGQKKPVQITKPTGKGIIHNGLSDRFIRIQDRAISQLPRKKK